MMEKNKCAECGSTENLIHVIRKVYICQECANPIRLGFEPDVQRPGERREG